MQLLLVVSGVVATFLAGNWLLHQRAKRLARSRSGSGFEDFAPYFSAENIPQDKLRLVYNYLQDWQSIKDFPVQATDNLCKVYGICDEDLDDAVVELAAKWRVVLPADFTAPGPVNTVADVVRLLAALPYGRNNNPV